MLHVIRKFSFVTFILNISPGYKTDAKKVTYCKSKVYEDLMAARHLHGILANWNQNKFKS
jgi:hypothetical protein